MLNILLVGCGKMGSAMAERWKDAGIYTRMVVVDSSSEEFKSPSDIPADFIPNVIVFAVKPQIIGSIIGEYKKFTDNGATVISIIAGKTINFFEEHLGTNAKIVRSMPNLPASIGKGMIAAFSNNNVSAEEKEWADKILSSNGEFIWVEHEAMLDPVTAVSGSGPAYVFLLIETLMTAAEVVGLDKDTAEKLAIQTVVGSAALIEQNPDISASQFRENVTSKGGTTAAALEILMDKENGIQQLFNKAIIAAKKRAEELSN